MEDQLSERKKVFLEKLKKENKWLIYSILAIIVIFSYYVRTRNLPLLIDIVTGKYIAADLDAQLFMRYSQYILEHGKLFALDLMRNYPLGFPTQIETPLLPYFVVYLYKFLHFFTPSITLEYVNVIYPAITTIVTLVFFFLFVRKLFNNNWIGLIATAFLAVMPSFLMRTMAGYSDKEALAVMFMFMAFYFYVASWKSEKIRQNMIYGFLAGITTGLTGLVWGGVNFLFMIVGLFVIIEIVLGRFRENEFYAYVIFFITTVAMLLLFGGARFTPHSLLVSSTAIAMILAFLMSLIDYFVMKKDKFKIKEKLTKKLPEGVVTLLIALSIGIIVTSVVVDWDFIIHKPYSMIYDMLYPLKDRWALTVAESHEPYITDWIGQFGRTFVFLFIASSILMVYEMSKKIKKYKWWIVSFYTVFIFAFIFSRYSRDSILNGTSPIAKVMYIGSLTMLIVGIIIFYIYLFKKDKESFQEVTKIEKHYLFTIIFFIIMIMGARRAIRLVFIFAPIVAVLAGYLFYRLLEYAKLFKKDIYKIAGYVAVLLIIGYFLNGFTSTTLDQATYTGSIYNVQWQKAMGWVRENTPQDAVFGHWWDYGYLVQTGGERATVTDGGNAIGYWNYLMGRHALTGQSDEEALEFLYAHNVSYFLIEEAEIGKYPAFSSIGSDANYDRYSWINVFSLDRSQSQETRDQIIYLYKGGTPLDEDFIYQDKVFPAQRAGIGGFLLPIKQEENQTQIQQPTAVLFYNGQQTRVPLECVFVAGKEVRFPEPGIKGCLQIVPRIENQQVDPMGAAFYLSERVVKGRFGQYYMFGKESEYFELVYNDEQEMPLAIYNGRIIGPLKIWKINYPEGMQVNQTYLQREFPDPSVTRI
ncbi:MAG: STT3 domain-containing protein [archaeon]